MVLNIQTCSVYQKDGCTFFGMQPYGDCNTLSHSADRQTSYHELQQRGGTKGGYKCAQLPSSSRSSLAHR